MPPKSIVIEGAQANNLKRFDCAFPRGKLALVTGPSGSGKSSLVFGTLLVEARRKVAAPMRCDLSQQSPNVVCRESFGLSYPVPVSPGSQPNRVLPSVSSVSGIGDDVEKLYFALGTAHCIQCDAELPNTSLSRSVAGLEALTSKHEITVLAPIPSQGASRAQAVEHALSEGFSRALAGDERIPLEQLLIGDTRWEGEKLYVLIDAFPGNASKASERTRSSLSVARRIAEPAVVRVTDEGRLLEERGYSETPVCMSCGNRQNPLLAASFSPFRLTGRCSECVGAGMVLSYEIESLLDVQAPILGNAVFFSRRTTLTTEEEEIRRAKALGIRKTTTWSSMSERKRDLLIFGEKGRRFFPMILGRVGEFDLNTDGIAGKAYVDAARRQELFVSPLFRCVTCPQCRGSRVRREAAAARVGGVRYSDAVLSPLSSLLEWSARWEERCRGRSDLEAALKRLRRRLEIFAEFGLGHLTPARSARSLSSGEYQRSELVRELLHHGAGVTYLIDEPSVGLHPRDLDAVIDQLKALSSGDSAVIVIDHHEALLAAAEHLVILGPHGGSKGGELVYAGEAKEFAPVGDEPSTVIEPSVFPPAKLSVRGLSIRNVVNANVDIPLHSLVGVCGVSGSGKSSAFVAAIEPALRSLLQRRRADKAREELSQFGIRSIDGWQALDRVAVLNRIALSKDSRSSVGSILGALPILQTIYASTIDAKVHGISLSHFSRRNRNARCPNCGGKGLESDSSSVLSCRECQGTGLTEAALSVRWRGRSLRQLLSGTIDEAYESLSHAPVVGHLLRAVSDLGLGYLQLSQRMKSLSAGEQQRLRLAALVARGTRRRTLFILDEPSRGLGANEVDKMIGLFRRLLDSGHSFVIIEHRPRCLKMLDTLIEFGPGSGAEGGKIIATGTVSEVRSEPRSVIAAYL